MERKYSIAEVEGMRQSVETLCTRYGQSYDPKERVIQVEQQLRTYMQNGTDPKELAEAASERIRREIEAQDRMQEMYRQRAAAAPKPRELKTKEDVLEEWFATCVAKYEQASVTAKELYDGFGGHTLKSFANQKAPSGIHLRQSDMERFLDKKGIRSRNAMFAKRYDGIRHIIHGDVRSGNYGT